MVVVTFKIQNQAEFKTADNMDTPNLCVQYG